MAYFGTFGYELDLLKLSEEEKEEIRRQNRIHEGEERSDPEGTFYRLKSPFEGMRRMMIVSEDQKKALVGYYRGNVSRSMLDLRD